VIVFVAKHLLTMASSHTQQTRSAANCIICHQRLHKPKLLPCSHVCCEDCLRDFVVGRMYDAVGHFPCPRCSRSVRLPVEGVRAFPNRSQLPSSSSMLTSKLSFVVSGDLIVSFGCYGTGVGDLTQPVGLTVKTSVHEIVVTDQSTNRIITYSCHGELKSVFACRHSVADVDVTPRGTVVVATADAQESLAVEYDHRTGARLRSFGRFNHLETTNAVAVLSGPFAVAVSSFETGTIHLLSETGRLVRKFSRRSVTGRARHLCSNSRGDIVVSDYENSRVVVIDRSSGSCLAKMGGIGTAMGFLYQPLGVCVDSSDNIIVADSGNQRVVRFSKHGSYSGTIIDLSIGIGKPCNVACMPSAGQLIVLVTGRHYAQIRVYSYHANACCDDSRNGALRSLCVC